MNEPDPVLLDTTREGVAVITLNRPELHNAFNPDVIEMLSDIFEDLRGADGVRVVMIAGEGKSFSAGADLTWMRAAADYTRADNREDAGALADMLRRLNTLPQPTIALVHGPAIAGGMGIVSACDIAIATRQALFGLSEVRLGIIPAVISPYVLEAIGPRAARRYFLTGERFDAEEAFRLGLVHAVVEDRNAMAAEAEKIVAAILDGAPGAIREAKELIEYVSFSPIEDVMDETARMIADRRSTSEAKEGLSAFLEKRKPSWAKG
ncbi:MAG: enoyl-CoA hydratase/isomerase family protein [Alphaproteobacteria bacterium]|nr:enoyl-CoA hydratase/isomerase family protein [Alphaproteobacteria bacterium]